MSRAQFFEKFWREIGTGFLASCSMFALLGPADGTIAFLAKLICSSLVGIFVGLAVALLKARKAVFALIDAGKLEEKETRGVRTAFLFSSVKRYVETFVRKWRRGGWVRVKWAPEVREFTSICFERCDGRYIGTDRHVPSQFFRLYPEYYGSQRSRGVVRGDLRIVLYDQASLVQDYRTNATEAEKFVTSHIQDGVRLLGVPLEKASSHADSLALPSTDLGLFGGEFVVFFDPPRLPKSSSRGRILIESMNNTLADKLESYLAVLAAEASELVLDNGVPRMIKRDDQTRDADVESVSRMRW